MIITKTPFRMSFFGGGTDMESFFRENGGAVLSTTFDKYCYVNVRHLPRFFDYSTELSYSKTERVTNIDDIQHPAIRNAMKMLDMHEIRLTYEADLPARSGLGTSSSFAVGMLNAFYALKGKYADKKKLADEAKKLAEQGVKELILVAQETTMYGKDIYGKKSLHILLKELAKISGIYWIRVLYCYPEEIYDELIQVMKEEKKICHYLDLPIQHASDRILKRMGRRTSKAQLVGIITKLRREIPDIVLRTSLITGFPGETEEDHQELMEFVDEMEFDRLGVFTYSPEEGTPAETMEEQVPEELKEERRDEIMELQQEISLEKGNDRIGQELLVMIEGKVSGESAYIGRTYGDAPKVDGYMFVQTGELLVTGDFAKVKVTGAMEYDLIGELADEYTE